MTRREGRTCVISRYCRGEYRDFSRAGETYACSDVTCSAREPPHAGASSTMTEGARVSRLWPCFWSYVSNIVSDLSRYLTDYGARSTLADAPASPCASSPLLALGGKSICPAILHYACAQVGNYYDNVSAIYLLSYCTLRCHVHPPPATHPAVYGPSDGLRACTDR